MYLHCTLNVLYVFVRKHIGPSFIIQKARSELRQMEVTIKPVKFEILLVSRIFSPWKKSSEML